MKGGEAKRTKQPKRAATQPIAQEPETKITPVGRGDKMPTKVNMSNLGSDFETLPNDRYLAIFAKYEVRTAGPNAKNPGSKYFSLEFHIDGEAHPDYKNRRVWNTLGGTVNSLWAVKEFLITMGYPQEVLDDDSEGEDPAELSDDQLAAAISEMLDKVKSGSVYLDLSTETYPKKLKNGTIVEGKRNKVENYISVLEAAPA